MEDNNRRAALEQRRDRIITLLAKYPGLDDDELADLLHWFKKGSISARCRAHLERSEPESPI